MKDRILEAGIAAVLLLMVHYAPQAKNWYIADAVLSASALSFALAWLFVARFLK